MTQTSVAVIPARGGSKRVPRKNIRSISGQPLIAWAIRLCLESGAFDDVVVSTDDDEIAQTAEKAGARVPFRRPATLSDDLTPTVDVIAHAIAWLGAQGQPIDLACCVYPASVFLPATDLKAARDTLLAHPDASYAATVVPYPHPVQRALRLSADGALSFVQPAFASARTQDLEPLWHDAGQFYWGLAQAWLDCVPILPNAVGYPVDAARVCDIDTEDDWRRAEVLHALTSGGSPGGPPAVG